MTRYQRNRCRTLLVCFKSYCYFLQALTQQWPKTLTEDVEALPHSVICLNQQRFVAAERRLSTWVAAMQTVGDRTNSAHCERDQLMHAQRLLEPAVCLWLQQNRDHPQYPQISRRLLSFFRLSQAWAQWSHQLSQASHGNSGK